MFVHQLPIGQRIALALALPIAGLLFFAFWVLLGQQRVAGEMRALREMAELATAVSRLVHELQRERGLSAAFLGTQGNDFAEWRAAQQTQTDAQLAQYEESLQADGLGRFDALLGPRLDRAREQLALLGAWRAQAGQLQVSDEEQTARYTAAIHELIAIVREMHLVGALPWASRAIGAYVSLMQAKELAGMERAVGAMYFAAPRVQASAREAFVALASRQSLYLEQFRSQADPPQVALLDTLLADLRLAEIERMRAQVHVRAPAAQRAGGGAALQWFDAMTWKIDQFQQVEARVAQDLVAASREAESTAGRAVLSAGLVVLLVLGLALVLAGALARGIILPIRRITEAMNRLAAPDARDAHVPILDQERGDEIGDMARATLVFRDNVARIAQAEERLRSALALRLHHEALQAISQGVLIVDAQGLVTYCNPALCAITGRALQDIVGQAPDFLWGDERARAQLWGGAAGQPCVGQGQRRDGTPFWFEAVVNPVQDGEGGAMHRVVVLRDITESRRVEQEMRIAATAFESMHGMIVTDAQTHILRVNRAFTAMTGYGAEEVVGRKPSMFQSGRHDAQFYADMWRALKERGAWFGEIWDRRKNGAIYPLLQSISAVRNDEGQVTHYVAAFADISERKEAEEKIRHLAFYDPLTHLPNRRLLLDRLQHAMALSERMGSHGALMFIDLDQFKSLNDTLGHDVGDLLLIEVARRLQETVRASDTAGRQGGDEFVVMLEDLAPDAVEAAAQARAVAEKLLAVLNQPYQLAGRELRNTPSIGVTLFRGQETSLDALMRQADLAMYQSKTAGRNMLHFFDPQMQEAVTQRVQMDTELQKGLERGEFRLHYQPQVDAQGRILGAEALLRWMHPQRGTVLPGEFIALAEETGLIIPLGQWVLEEACRQLAQWSASAATAPLVLSVNVSARQFHQPDFVAGVLQALQQTGAPATRLRLELTESLMLHDVEGVIAKMQELRAHGVGFALDDFGTGYSSLSYLRRLPLDVLKIDRAFVRDIVTEPNVASIAHGIVHLAQSLGLSVVAEGVEQPGQFDILQRQGCTGYQGYLFGRPVPAQELRLPSHPL
ncbi:MAG: hypothetical protein BGO74_04505 [Burkholderiales bacterium 68-12]|nr:MAG: hypothetical protein BGO74_04505 [Burkholderiales bacterium 68-12]